jgi:ABC-type phosphate/phosphonate transport system permease subunit
MALLEYERAMMAVLVTLLLVFGAERISDYLRRRVLDGGRLA